MKIYRLLSLGLLFVFITFGALGGCGGGDGDDGDEIIIELICDDGLDNDGNGFTDCDDLACVIDPACGCESPPLDTDFSDRGVFFIDSENAVLIGLTSFGDDFELLLADIPDSGLLLTLVGDVVSSTVGDITLSQFILDGVLQPILPATGECRLENNFTDIVIENLSIIGVAVPDLNGVCNEIIFFEDVVKTPSDNLTSLENALNNKMQKILKQKTRLNDKAPVLDLYRDLLKNLEE